MASEEPAALSPGLVLDGWRVGQRLHVGGMAEIWCVEPLATEADDADAADSAPLPAALVMKVPRIRGGEDPASIVGFEVEQMILPALAGPHVPRYVARSDFTEQPYLVMERIEGDSLRPRLDAAPLALDEVVAIGERVANALHELHRQGLVHLDVKPSNIMFRTDGTAVLVDFGLSRHDKLPDLLEEEFTLPIGTSPYMSPEQVQHIRKDPRSDLFALGVMLYHFTTGQRPFGQPESVRGLRQRLFTDPVPPRSWRPDCPPWLQEIILKCLEVDPAQRWQSGAQLALALAHPQQVPLTARADKRSSDGAWSRLRRWWRGWSTPVPMPRLGAASQLFKNPIVMAAVDIDHAAAGLLEQMREAVLRIVATEPGARLACVSVMRAGGIAMDDRVDTEGRSRHVKQLVALKHWARPVMRELALDEGRITFHVLEAPDPALAIVEFAERTRVDHIVMGARGHSALRRYLGSVSSQVVAQAPCTVTVVRA